MLKIKYLFDNRDLTKMLLGNWQYDENSLDEWLQYYRISSNAVYPYKSNATVHILRFSPVSEKSIEHVQSEVDFLAYLSKNNYPCPNLLKDKNGDSLNVSETPWGLYSAISYASIGGNGLESSDFNQETAHNYGRMLGRLHRLSSEYRPENNKRWSYDDVLDWCAVEATELTIDSFLADTIDILRNQLNLLPRTSTNYGLIHYDFELDNIIYNASDSSMSVIDFDDSMYHWYVMDIAQVFNCLDSEVDGDTDHFKKYFLQGYRDHYDISEEVLNSIPIMLQFSKVYSYVRLLRCLKETWNNEPTWLLDLRSELELAKEELENALTKM